MSKGTYFYEGDNRIASDTGILPLPLHVGMPVTIHGFDTDVFEVIMWTYHHGHEDEDPGLHVYLRRLPDDGSEPKHDQAAAMKRVKEAAREKALRSLES